MKNGRMILIAAVADNRVIGKDGKIPWERIPGDLPRFKALTTGHAVVMGRKTYESLGKPLADRLNIVVSNQCHYNYTRYPNLAVHRSLDGALEAAQNHREDRVFYVIGGAEIYRQTIDDADILDITHVHQMLEGDAFFPEIKKSEWSEIDRKDYMSHSFVTYVRVNESK